MDVSGIRVGFEVRSADEDDIVFHNQGNLETEIPRKSYNFTEITGKLLRKLLYMKKINISLSLLICNLRIKNPLFAIFCPLSLFLDVGVDNVISEVVQTGDSSDKTSQRALCRTMPNLNNQERFAEIGKDCIPEID